MVRSSVMVERDRDARRSPVARLLAEEREERRREFVLAARLREGGCKRKGSHLAMSAGSIVGKPRRQE